jgi:ubiquinone/menaquinone biosynthesis C-methylase UbiE
MTLRGKLLATVFAVVVLSVPNLPAQTPAPPSHPTSTPYAGDLSIFEEPGRDQRLQIDRVMDLLHLKPGSTIADIGAGGGWFSVRAARRVGPKGRVIAEDINPKFIASIQQRAQREHLANIVPLLGTPDDPKLTPDSLDAALMLKVYHEIAHPLLVLANLRAALATATAPTMASKSPSCARRSSTRASARLLATISPRAMDRITSSSSRSFRW